jgi:integrase
MDILTEYFSEQNSKWDSLAISWLQSAIITGLRPQEWETAQLDGFKLIVKNAKNTNGRCFSSHRTLDLSQISEEDYDDIETFISQLNLHVRENNNNFEYVYKQCRNRLYKVTRKLWPGRDKYPALYTGRHQFSANAKRNQNREEVAALMGHKNDATATEHYGKRRHGEEKTDMVRPDPNEVAQVERVFSMPNFDESATPQIDRGGEPT